ncbi:MAG: YfiR family protein [Bacteroidota bacterium]
MKRAVIVVLLIGLISFKSPAQVHKFKAIFVYKLMQNIQWPQTKAQEKYKLGIVGKDDIEKYLNEIFETRKVNNKSVEVRIYKPGESVEGFHMIYVPDKSKAAVDGLREEARKHAVVLVGESPGIAQQGANLNLLTDGGKLKFEMNKAYFDQSNIKVQNTMSSLAILVEE